LLKTIAFCVEASQEIGMGHLMESLALADHFINLGAPLYFIVNPYEPSRQELQKRGIAFVEYELDKIDDVIRFIKQKDVQYVIINHRKVSLNSLQRIHNENNIVVVIDQLGDKAIICDLLINKSLVSKWLQYDFPINQPLCCFGADYAILGDCYRKLHSKKNTFSKDRYTVLVSMGGVDRTGATLRIIEALRQIENVSKEIVIGKGFAHMKQLNRLCERNNDPYFVFSFDVSDLSERISKADIVISAGGNTLFEMACVGTPGIVLWEDEHEYTQGVSFEKKGTVICIGNGIKTPINVISDSVRMLLKDSAKREKMSQCGKRMVDGQGKKRICSKIMELNQLCIKQ
jgi:spore coat polysaccharide biosynthesis predicted glycosyltransferase SpsG